MTTPTIHEIVEVRSDGTVIGPGSRVSTLASDIWKRSMPGFYLVLKSASDDSHTQCRQIHCFGPFGDRTLAETLQTSARYLGILGSGKRAPARSSAAFDIPAWQAHLVPEAT